MSDYERQFTTIGAAKVENGELYLSLSSNDQEYMIALRTRLRLLRLESGSHGFKGGEIILEVADIIAQSWGRPNAASELYAKFVPLPWPLKNTTR